MFFLTKNNEATYNTLLIFVAMNDYADFLCESCRFIYLFIGIGAVVVVVACCGCIGTATRNGCCLTCVSYLIIPFA